MGSLELIRTTIHYGLHFGLPVVIARTFYRQQWKWALLLLSSTMLIDFDHLFSDPIFDPNRLSIGFHLLHSYVAIFIYVLLFIPKKTRILAVGLLLHILIDLQDYGISIFLKNS